jgi:hypothetical protein
VVYYIDWLAPDAFSIFPTNDQSRKRIIVTGSNDGLFRAVSTSGGEETNASLLSAAGMGDSPLKQRLQDTGPSTQVLH